MGPKTSTPEIRRLAEIAEPWLAASGGAGILAGVSGGPDSTAMLLALVELRRQGSIPGVLRVVHVDHRVRADSQLDAQFVRALATSLDLQCRIHTLSCGRLRDKEAELRTARYAAFRTELRTAGCRVLTTAHHASDVVETFLFRLRRGSSLRGLAGIPRTRPLSSATEPSDPVGLVVRPLLDASPAELIAACRSVGIQPRIDPSNADETRSRNHLRHRVLPVLSARDSRFESRIRHACEIARRVTESTELRARAWLVERASYGGGQTFLRLHSDDDPPVRTEAFRALHLAMLGIEPSRAWLRRADSLANGPSGRRLSGRPPAVEIERTTCGLLWTRRGSVASCAQPLHTLRPGAASPSSPGP